MASAAAPPLPPAAAGPMKARNPMTGVQDYTFDECSPADVTAAVAAVRSEQTAWAASTVQERCAVLVRWAAAVEAEKGAIMGALAQDTGRIPLSGMEVMVIGIFVKAWTAQAPYLLAPMKSGADSYTEARGMPSMCYKNQKVPFGVVGVISPWNFPLILSFIDAIPALLAGCAVVIKPSEVTPRFVDPLLRAIAAVPELAKVLKIVRGGGVTGAALVPAVDAVCFTGSVATGRKVAAAAAQAFIPAFLELGGKDPAIVLASSDVKAAASALLRGSCANTGQACQSVERIYVAKEVYEEFLAELLAEAAKTKLAYPGPKEGQLGPFIFAPQADIVARHVADAVAKGASVRCGGEISNEGGGLWCGATVLTGVDHSMAVMKEETFGPVMPVMPFETVDDAVRLANDSAFGLSASVFAGSVDEAEAVAVRLNAGAVSINDASLTAYMHQAENDLFGASGMGRSRMGASGLLRFFRVKALIAQTGTPRNIFGK